MLKMIGIGIVCFSGIAPAISGEYAFCLLVNQVADGGKLRDYSDRQVENGLCMISKEIISAITTEDSLKESICTTAADHMMAEFKRRFPNRPARDVIGRC